MSIRSKVITAALALSVIGGVGAAGTLTANAASTKCGPICEDLFSEAFGTAAHPGYIPDVRNQVSRAGQPVILAKATDSNAGEDFGLSAQGQVSDFVKAGLVPSGLGKLYGSLNVVEIQYAPKGSPAGLCIGVGTTPGAGTPVTLQRCGVTAKTLWIFDPETTSAGTYYVLINGATASNFTDPSVLTAGLPGLPLLTTAPLAAGHPTLTHQLWGAIDGVIPTS